MPRPPTLKPSYCRDKTSGQAYVRLSGRKHYLGAYGSRKSRDKYDQLIGQWIASGRAPLPQINPHDAGSSITVSTLINAWITHAHGWYGTTAIAGRRPSGELGNYWDVLSELRRLYGPTRANDFGPKALKALAAALATDRTYTDAAGAIIFRRGMCRNVVNRSLSRVKHVFKWGVEEELLPGEAHYRLQAVRGIPPGRGQARESDPVTSVSDEHVAAVLPYLSRHVAAMVRVQRLSGMRPGEVCAMRRCDLDTRKPVWLYQPPKHKTAHHGKTRQISLGPKAQEILATFPPRTPDPAEYVFSPADAERERNEQRRRERQTPLTPSQILRAQEAVGRQRQRPPRDHYDVASYRRAVERACELAFGMPRELRPRPADTPEQKDQKAAGRSEWRREHKWRLNQLRHTAATATRRQYGLDAAQLLLGHSSRRMTEVYAEPDTELAARVMLEIG